MRSRFIDEFASSVCYNLDWYCGNLGREDRGADYTVQAMFLQGEKFITTRPCFVRNAKPDRGST